MSRTLFEEILILRDARLHLLGQLSEEAQLTFNSRVMSTDDVEGLFSILTATVGAKPTARLVLQVFVIP